MNTIGPTPFTLQSAISASRSRPSRMSWDARVRTPLRTAAWSAISRSAMEGARELDQPEWFRGVFDGWEALGRDVSRRSTFNLAVGGPRVSISLYRRTRDRRGGRSRYTFHQNVLKLRHRLGITHAGPVSHLPDHVVIVVIVIDSKWFWIVVRQKHPRPPPDSSTTPQDRLRTLREMALAPSHAVNKPFVLTPDPPKRAVAGNHFLNRDNANSHHSMKPSPASFLTKNTKGRRTPGRVATALTRS